MNIFRKVMNGFVAWNHKPRDRTPEQVAQLLRAALNGTATHRDMDYFTSIDITDPTLNDIKDEIGTLYGPGWETDYTRQKLTALLRRVEALSNSG